MTEKKYRTLGRAGEDVCDISGLPGRVSVITNALYRNAITLNPNGQAYMAQLSSMDNLKYENGVLYFKGLPATNAELRELCTKETAPTIDLMLLRSFYTMVLNNFEKTYSEDQTVSDIITLYVPQLAKYLGLSGNLSRHQVVSLIREMNSFQTIVGVIDGNILPVFLYMGEDRDRNTISFASPYMTRVIREIYHVSIRRDKAGKQICKKDGTPELLPSHSWLIKNTINKERNKKAVEIVCIVVATIEAAGSGAGRGGMKNDLDEAGLPHGSPHISARTIIERSSYLFNSLNSISPSNRNLLLKRAFSKAWELLRTQTTLSETYRDIELPDPYDEKNIPTTGTLDKVFTFTHHGKICAA